MLAASFCVLALSGCATTHANAAPDTPALDMPPPPVRVIEAADTEPPQPATLPDEPSRRAVPPPPRRTPTPAPRPEPKEPPKTEPPAPTPPSEPPKPPAEAAKAPTTLQTTSADAEGKEDQQIRALLAKASSDLKRIDYRRLDAGGRTQYDTAKGFVKQAENALRVKNLVMAHTVADKAAAIAAQLAGK
jgi:hypothetical protein